MHFSARLLRRVNVDIRKANAVKTYLVNEGIIAPDRLSTVGYGETNPAMYEAAPKEIYSKAAMVNMRVLFEVIVK